MDNWSEEGVLRPPSPSTFSLSSSYLDELEWLEDDHVTLVDLAHDQLPQVVRLHPEDLGAELGPNVDVHTPFLVYSRRRRTRVRADCMYVEGGQLVPAGPPVDIPKDFPGWFEVYGPDGAHPEQFTSLSQVAECGCQRFLLRTLAYGFRFSEHDGQLILQQETKVFPGEVLRVLGTAERHWQLKQAPPEGSSPPKTTFLKCEDGQGRQVCVSLAHPGLYSPLLEPGGPDNAVSTIDQLLGRAFPLVVRLVFGWPPASPARPFTGFLQLLGLTRPDTLILCNLQPGRSLFLELPIDFKLRLVKANAFEAVGRHDTFQKLLSFCHAKVFPFVIAIKTMAIGYQKENGKKGGIALPVNMQNFNPLDVYPPIDRRDGIAEGFALTFTERNEEDEEEESFERGGMTRGESVALDKQGRRKGGVRREDARELRLVEERNREATC